MIDRSALLPDNNLVVNHNTAIAPIIDDTSVTWFNITKQYIRLSGPIVMANLCRHILITIDLVFLVHYSMQQQQGVIYLAASGITDIYICPPGTGPYRDHR